MSPTILKKDGLAPSFFRMSLVGDLNMRGSMFGTHKKGGRKYAGFTK